MDKEKQINRLEDDFVKAIDKRMIDSKFTTSRREIRRCLTNAIKTIEKRINDADVSGGEE